MTHPQYSVQMISAALPDSAGALGISSGSPGVGPAYILIKDSKKRERERERPQEQLKLTEELMNMNGLSIFNGPFLSMNSYELKLIHCNSKKITVINNN